MDNVILLTVLPTVTLFGLLWLLHLCVRSPERSTRDVGKSGKTRNEFRVRDKPLEDSWRGKGEFRGWFTFLCVLVAFTTLRTVHEEYIATGHFFSRTSLQYLLRAFVAEAPEFISVVAIQYALCLGSFLLQKLLAVSGGSRGRLVVTTAHWLLVGVLFGGSCLYTYRRLNVLSLSARFAIVTQGAVLCMKSVSYFAMNARLFELVVGLKKDDKQIEPVSALTLTQVEDKLRRRGVVVKGEYEGELRRQLETFRELDEYRAQVWPSNVTLRNFVEFTTMPVLVYEPRYPRTQKTSGTYVARKTAELVGLHVVGLLVVERSILPVVNNLSMPLYAKVVELLVPVSLVFLVLFFVVFDCIFPALAEITGLADRGFYGPWWNATSFADFSCLWNKPVHEFLLRHVHVAAIEIGLSRKKAAMLTFLVSITLHEILITALLGSFRPYLAFFSIFQIPLWPIMRSPVFSEKLIGNVFFWVGLLLGITLVVVLYFSEYCRARGFCTLD
jgi:hypothetical protein